MGKRTEKLPSSRVRKRNRPRADDALVNEGNIYFFITIILADA
jgi:hypothetical protein